MPARRCLWLFFFNDTAPTEIYTLSLPDALPISFAKACGGDAPTTRTFPRWRMWTGPPRSEEHTSELQSLAYLVCRLLLEKKRPSISAHPPTPAPRPRTRTSRHAGRPCHRCDFFQAEDGIRDKLVTGSDVCSSDLPFFNFENFCRIVAHFLHYFFNGNFSLLNHF